jgi:hypothetical protein
MRRQSRALAIIALCFIALYSLQLWSSRRRPTSDPMCDHSALRTNAWGIRAFRELLDRSGLTTRLWLRGSWAELTPEVRMMWVLDPQRKPSDDELKSLATWLEAGGTLVIAPDPRERERGMRWGGPEGGQRMLQHFGWSVVGDEAAPPSRLRAAAGHPATRDVRCLSISGFRLQPLPTTRDRRYTALVRDARGPVAVRQSRGRGVLFVLADADLLANRWIAGADNVVLAANLAFLSPDATVWFDENCHTPRFGAGAAPLDRAAPIRVIWALLAAIALYVIGRMQRFGEAVGEQAPPRRSALETVHAFASVYQRAGRPEAALKWMTRRLHRRLERLTGLGADTDPVAVARAATLRRPVVDEDALAETLRRCAAAEQEASITDAGLLDLARRIARAEEELGQHGH